MKGRFGVVCCFMNGWLIILIIILHVFAGANVEQQHEPSHVRICRALLDPSLVEESDETGDGTLIIYEDDQICGSKNYPFHALTSIFASQLLSEVAFQNGIKIMYRHDCHLSSSTSLNVQSRLPTPLPFIPPKEEFTLNMAKNACSDSLRKQTLDGRWNVGYLVLRKVRAMKRPHYSDAGSSYEYPRLGRLLRSQRSLGIGDLPIVLEFVLPSLRHAVQLVAKEWHDSSLQEWIFRENYAVVYLSCQYEICQRGLDSAVLEMPSLKRAFALEIPAHVNKIDVIADIEFKGMFKGYGEELCDYLRALYPRAAPEVTYSVEPSSFVSFAKMVKARFLVCLGMPCLLPAVASGNYASVLTQHRKRWWVNEIAHHYNMHLALFGEERADGRDCVALRGRDGVWVQDWDNTPSMQYNLNGAERSDYDASTSYRWEERIFQECPVIMLTKESLCRAVKTLGIKRVMFLGDSLTKEMAESFYMLFHRDGKPVPLTRPDVPDPNNPYYKRVRNNDYTHILACPATVDTDPYYFDFSFLRNDIMAEIGIGMSGDHLALPWIEKYLSYPGKTLLVANAGPHIHEFPIFQRVFDDFLKAVDEGGRYDDIIYFRNSVPGHRKCHLYKRPFTNYKEYKTSVFNTTTEKLDRLYNRYSWDLFTHYNDYASRKISERNRRADVDQATYAANGVPHPSPKTVRVDLLDVYGMSVLRPDGHLYPDLKIRKDGKGQDCLHSRLPGPLDWWNHLLVSNLHSLAVEEEMEHLTEGPR